MFWDTLTYILVVVTVNALLALVPACIARGKGYPFWQWWLYGFLLYPAALIHSCLLRRSSAQPAGANGPSIPSELALQAEAELEKYRELFALGALTAREFALAKWGLSPAEPAGSEQPGRRSRVWAYAAAACFAVAAAIAFRDGLASIFLYARWRSFSLSNLMEFLPFFVILSVAAALFAQNQTALMIITGLYGVSYTLLYISYRVILPFIVFFVVLLMARFLSKVRHPLIKYLWFLPGVLFPLVLELQNGVFTGLYRYYIYWGVWNWPLAVFVFAHVAGVFFLCLWLKVAAEEAPNPSVPPDPARLIGSAEQIRRYKELHDAGILTRKEFSLKKKQILGR